MRRCLAPRPLVNAKARTNVVVAPLNAANDQNMETKKYSISLGGKTAHVAFSKQGSNYKVRTWGLKYRDIEKHLEQYRQWLTACVEDFGEEIGERLFLKTSQYHTEFKHTLEPLSAGLARDMDINPSKQKILLDVTNSTPEQLEKIKQTAAQMGGRVRKPTADEIRHLSPPEKELACAHLMVPNPMQPPADGQAPQVAYRKYLVIRFLPGPEMNIDKQTSLVWHLAERCPLVTVCRDGEEPEGLEAWFKVEGWPEKQTSALMDYACTLGADPETFDPLCMVHIPGAVNPVTGKEQKLVYLKS
jgi:hypothetical protein